MAHQNYIELSDGSKFTVENFKLLTTQDKDVNLIDDDGEVYRIHVPETLKVKFEIDLDHPEHAQAVSLLKTGVTFTAVCYDYEEEDSRAVRYCNCQVYLVNEHPEVRKAYVICNWIYDESNLQDV